MPDWACVATQQLAGADKCTGEVTRGMQPRIRRFIMSSEALVVIVLVALAIAGLVYLERNSRRNKKEE
jgi:hypothetical protein